MVQSTQRVRVIEGVAPDAVPWDELVAAEQPALLKGLVRDWPLARVSSPQEAVIYLKSFYQGRPVVAFIARPELKGRFSYTPDATRLDFQSERGPLDDYLERVMAHLGDANAPSIYIGSTDVDLYLPGFRAANDLVLNHPMFAASPPMVGAWIGNRTTALAHHDMSHNVACVTVGRRRFTLFPPEQVENLYPGPLEPTPGGQVVTMADIQRAGLRTLPELREALAAAQVAEMEPGDALFYPAMWWHQVEALESFNVMINYWWNTVAGLHGHAAEHAAACPAQPARSAGAGEARLARDVRLLRVRPGRQGGGAPARELRAATSLRWTKTWRGGCGPSCSSASIADGVTEVANRSDAS